MCTALRCRGIYAAPLINNVLIEFLISMAILSQKCGLRLVMVLTNTGFFSALEVNLRFL